MVCAEGHRVHYRESRANGSKRVPKDRGGVSLASKPPPGSAGGGGLWSLLRAGSGSGPSRRGALSAGMAFPSACIPALLQFSGGECCVLGPHQPPQPPGCLFDCVRGGGDREDCRQGVAVCP